MGGDFNQADVNCPDLWNELLVLAQVLDTYPQLNTFEGPTGRSALDRILCPTEYIAAAQIDVLVAANRRHHLSGHYQLTATFVVRPRVKSDMKDPIHQTIPTEVFCPGKNEANPYMVPNDLQELIRRIQRLPQTDSPGGGCGPPRGMSVRGGGGPVRVRGDVKLRYSAGELLKAPVPNEP